MNLFKAFIVFSLLGCASACKAASQDYMGCDWRIPAGYDQIAEFEYSNRIDEDDLENWVPASIMFTTYSGSEQEYYRNISQNGDSDVLLLSHATQPGGGFQYISSFVREDSFDTTIMVATLRIIKDDKMLAMSGVSKDDAIAITSGCAEFSQIEKHYDVQQQVISGYADFLKSSHGMQVLVP